MIKLSNRHLVTVLVDVKPFVCSREHILSEIFLVLLVPYFDVYLSAVLEFCRISTRLKIKNEHQDMFQDFLQRTPTETFQLKGTRTNTCKSGWSL